MTFRNILVPLDGSQLAEDVLVPVAGIAPRYDAEVTLLHVLERDAPVSVHGQRHITDPSEGTAYLEEVAQRLAGRGVRVRIHLHPRGVDSVAAAIDAHAHEFAVDLIAMCKHGRSGLRERMLGSIAQQILKGGGTPILLRTPRPEPSVTFEPRVVLVPLDFEHDVDAVFEVVAEFARRFEARVALLTAVPTPAAARRGFVPARFRPSATAAELEFEAEEAIAALKARGSQLAGMGVEVEVDISHDDPAEAILGAAAAEAVGLVVMSTHARAGFEAWLESGVGGRVIANAPENLLLLREL